MEVTAARTRGRLSARRAAAQRQKEGAGRRWVCGETSVTYNGSSPQPLAALKGCTRLLGSLRFGDSQLANLDGLESLRVVEGGLNLFRNQPLTNVRALRNLEAVAGALTIHLNYALPSIRDLATLGSVGGEVLIRGNDALTTLEGLGRLRSVAALAVLNNERLQSLQGWRPCNR